MSLNSLRHVLNTEWAPWSSNRFSVQNIPRTLSAVKESKHIFKWIVVGYLSNNRVLCWKDAAIWDLKFWRRWSYWLHSGLWRRMDLLMAGTNVPQKHGVSIFIPEMESVCSFETLVSTKSIRHHNQEGWHWCRSTYVLLFWDKKNQSSDI